jgi:hypothetical protein
MTDRGVITVPVSGAPHAIHARSALCIRPPNQMVRRYRPVGNISHSLPAMAQTIQYP